MSLDTNTLLPSLWGAGGMCHPQCMFVGCRESPSLGGWKSIHHFRTVVSVADPSVMARWDANPRDMRREAGIPGPWEAKQGLISHRAEAYYNWWKQDFQRTYLFHPSQTFAQELVHCIPLKNAWYFPWHHSWTLGWRGATLSSLQGINHCPPCFYTSIWAYTNATDFTALY